MLKSDDPKSNYERASDANDSPKKHGEDKDLRGIHHHGLDQSSLSEANAGGNG
jgi:hypothetical protein